MRDRLHIGIVGGGTAGSAAAIVLARRGHHVSVYERVPAPTAVGAGLLMQPTGLRVLERLGLAERILMHAAPIARLRCETDAGRCVFEIAYPRASLGHGLHRGVLFDALFTTAREAGAEIQTGRQAIGIVRHGLAARVRFADGELSRPFDLVIVADGARSQLQDDEPSLRRATPYPWGALWFVGEDREARFAGALHQVVRGTRRMLGLLPTGRALGGAAPMVSLFWSVPARDVPELLRGGIRAIAAEMLELAPMAESVVAQLERPEQLLFSTYWDVRMPRWDVGPVVYLGDAGHAMSPQLGQGANLALVDAWVLGEQIAAADDLACALAAYSRARRSPLTYYQWVTRLLTPFFQGDVGLYGVLRDLTLPWMSRLEPMRTVMVRTLTGS